MAIGFLRNLSQAIQKFEQTIHIIFGRGFPPAELCVIDAIDVPIKLRSPSCSNASSFLDILNNSFLWAVPKRRRSVEKRLSRRFGHPEYNWKPHVPRTDIVTCLQCGCYHEVETLCQNCYEEVKLATREMADKIHRILKLDQVEKDVVVLYENERKFTENSQQTVEKFMEEEKAPEWFDKNLLQPTSQQPSDRKDVKPKDVI